MEDLPLHSAIEELINIIFFEQKKLLSLKHSSTVAVEIKSSGSEYKHNDNHLYKIIVSGICKVPDISIYIQNGFLKSLLLIIKKMQTLIKNDYHLCEVEKCTDPNQVIQRNYNISEHPQTGEDQIDQSESQVHKKLEYKSNWYFRVYQRSQHMISECKSVYEHLQKLRIFNPEDIFKYSLELSEINCRPNFPPSSTFEINGKKMLNVVESHAKQAIVKDTRFKPIVSPSKVLNVFQYSNENNLKLTLVGLNINGNGSTYDESQKYLIEFFTFGPYGEPLHIPIVNEELSNLVSWEKYELQLTTTDFPNSSKSPLKPEWSIVAEPNTTNVSNEKYFHCVIYLIFEINHEADLGDINIHGELHYNFGSVLHRNNAKIKESVECVMDKLLAHKLNADRKRIKEDYAINTISDAIWNIVLRSTDEDFRENCLLTLGATSVHELKVLAEKKLRKVKGNERLIMDCDSQDTSNGFDMLEQVCPDVDSMDSMFEGFQGNNMGN